MQPAVRPTGWSSKRRPGASSNEKRTYNTEKKPRKEAES